MARIITTSKLKSGAEKTVENRDVFIGITVGIDDSLSVTIDRVALTRVDGEAVGGVEPVGTLRLSDDQVRAIPAFVDILAALTAVGDTTEDAIEKQKTQKASDAADAAAADAVAAERVP